MKRALGFMNKSAPLDPDAQAFITAAGLTDTTQKGAINTLVVDLKGYGLWTKLQAIYPFVGGTATTHKFNLKDPRDLDAAFRLTEVGTITHSSNGVVFTTAAFYYTNFNMVVDSIINDFHYSIYNRNNIADAYSFHVPTSGMQFFSRISNLLLSDMYNTSGTPRVLFSNSNSIGWYSASRIASNSHSIYRNGVLKANSTVSGGFLATSNVQINSLSGAMGINCAFATIGKGFTDAENSNLYTSVQAYQTTLARQV